MYVLPQNTHFSVIAKVDCHRLALWLWKDGGGDFKTLVTASLHLIGYMCYILSSLDKTTCINYGQCRTCSGCSLVNWICVISLIF